MLLNKIKNYVYSNWPLVASIFIFLVAYFLLNPLQNYTISDDFYYLIEVKNILNGIFIKNALIIPSFMLQGFIGAVWGYLFGLNFVSLRILTLIFALVCIYVFSLILDNLKLSNKIKFVSLVLLIFNPFFLQNVPSFMTEIYFLAFLLLGVLFFVKYLDTNLWRHVLLAGVFAGLSTMIRQFGLTSFVIFFVVIFYEFYNKKSKLSDVLYLLPGIALALVGILWPHYTNPVTPQSFGVTSLFGSLDSILGRVININIFPYLMFSCLALLLGYTRKINLRRLILALVFGALIGFFFFEKNIFHMGNVFYLEGIFAKAQHVLRPHIFNNIPVKILVSYILGVASVFGFYIIFDNVKNLIIYPKKIFLLVSMLGYFLIAAMPMVQYDRYYMYCLFFGILFFASLLDTINYDFRLICLGLIFTSITSYLLVYDLFSEYNSKFRMYQDMRSSGITQPIYFNLNLDKYLQIEATKNFDGTVPIVVYPDHQCFLVTYTKTDESWLDKKMKQFDGLFLRLYRRNLPTIEDWGYTVQYLTARSKEDLVIYDREYISPIYNLLGKKMGIRATCKRFSLKLLTSYK